MVRGRRRRSPAPASPMEDDNLLSEILLRLPPAPSSLPRTSLVCKQWRRLVSDPGFLRRFHARHRRNPPLLGFLKGNSCEISFIPTLKPPDRIPSSRLSLKLEDGFQFFDCRHGLVLLLNRPLLQVFVWDPITGHLSRIAFPPGIDNGLVHFDGAVLRAGDDVNGYGHSSHFQVVLLCSDEGPILFAHLYSSDSGKWGNLISIECHFDSSLVKSTLVEGSLYWLIDLEESSSTRILEFDLDRQRLAVMEMPSEVSDGCESFRVMRAAGGGLGFLHLSSSMIISIWKRKTDGDSGWVLRDTIDLDKLLSLSSENRLRTSIEILSFSSPVLVEDDNTLFLETGGRVFMIQLDSMKLKKGLRNLRTLRGAIYLPFSCVYAAGMGIGGEQDGVELLQNTP